VWDGELLAVDLVDDQRARVQGQAQGDAVAVAVCGGEDELRGACRDTCALDHIGETGSYEERVAHEVSANLIADTFQRVIALAAWKRLQLGVGQCIGMRHLALDFQLPRLLIDPWVVKDVFGDVVELLGWCHFWRLPIYLRPGSVLWRGRWLDALGCVGEVESGGARGWRAQPDSSSQARGDELPCYDAASDDCGCERALAEQPSARKLARCDDSLACAFACMLQIAAQEGNEHGAERGDWREQGK
jgi:hypothetical protein